MLYEAENQNQVNNSKTKHENEILNTICNVLQKSLKVFEFWKNQGFWKSLKADKVIECTWKSLNLNLFSVCWNFAFNYNFEANACMHVTILPRTVKIVLLVSLTDYLYSSLISLWSHSQKISKHCILDMASYS